MRNKKFLTYDEQLYHITEKQINVTDKQFVILCLQNHSYYSIINGFKDLYPTSYSAELETEIFDSSPNFEELYELYLLDSAINNVLFKYIIHVERSLKTKLAYTVAEKIGSSQSDYLNFNNYRDNGVLKRDQAINCIEQQIKKNDRNASVDHYRNKYTDIPPWIAVNILLFGSTINWYKILPTECKNDIALNFYTITSLSCEERKTLLASMLHLLQTYRNNIAHGNRTFETSVKKELPKNELLKALPTNVLTEEQFLKGYGNRDLYAVLLSLFLLIDDPFTLNYLRIDLENLFHSFKAANSPKGDIFDTLNLPRNILEVINIFIEHKYNTLYN